MLNMTNGEIYPDDKVVFYDGYLYIISRDQEAYIDKCRYHEPKYSIDVKCIVAEYDKPWTLADIAEKYPNVHKVIFDDMMKGFVYNYGNHNDEELWELVGTTMGYA